MSDLARTLDAVALFVSRFVVMSEHQLVAVTLWIAHTHALEASDYTPYLFVDERGARVGQVAVEGGQRAPRRQPDPDHRTCRRPALFRIAAPEDKAPPTFLMDEVDEIFAPEERAERAAWPAQRGLPARRNGDPHGRRREDHVAAAVLRLLPEAPRREELRRRSATRSRAAASASS